MKYTKTRRVILTLCLILVSCLISAQTAEELLPKAIQLEEVKGELEKAIEVYQTIVANFPDNKPVAAKAQLHIGFCNEKLGLKKAEKNYQKVIDEFPDQLEEVAAAKERLVQIAKLALKEKPETSAEPKGVVTRQILTGPGADVFSGAVSPDGRYFAFGDWRNSNGDLAVCELATGDTRLLTNDSCDYAGYVQSSVFSPDGKQLAYSWYNEDEFFELRTVGLDGSKSRILYRFPGVSFLYRTADWSRDGRFVLGCLRRDEDHVYQIVTVSVPEGSLRVLKILDKRPPGNMCFSPDGRYIAYDFPANEGSINQDIFLLARDSGEETTLVGHSAIDLLLGWAPEGHSLLFNSDRTGSWGAWLISVEEGKSEGSPKLINRNIGKIWPKGFTREGSFFYGIEGSQTHNVLVVEVDLAEGKLLNEPEPLIQHHMGMNGVPAWSHDGRYLAYVSLRKKRVPGGCVLCILDEKTGEERELLPKLAYFGLLGLKWSPDGNSIMIDGSDLTGRDGCFQIDTQNGEVTEIVIESGIGPTFAQWSNDGKSIFYVRNKWSENLSQILVRDLDTGQEEEIARAPENSNFAWLIISRDGQRLTFTEWRGEKDPTPEMVMPAQGGEMTELFGISYNKVWSPDGKKLLFTKEIESAGADSRNELWVRSVEGGEQKSMGVLMGVYRFNVHPDGTRIAFTRVESKPEIWVMENFLPEEKE